MRWLSRSLALCALFIVSFAARLEAADATPGKGRPWALLIGVEDYEKAPKLQFTANDVRVLADTLRQHGGFDADHILEITEQAADPADRTRKNDLMKRLPEWLQKPGPDDTVLVYFSGHGFRDKANRLFLAPVDCDPQNPTATGVPVEWFRDQIAACKANFKLLILDACHAGSEKGVDDVELVAAKDLGDQFKQSVGVVTLASSTGEEKSQLWPFKQQSLFSYWLKEGLKGHSDSNADGLVTVDELYDYMYGHVTQTAKIRFARPQTPTRIVGPRTPGVPVVLKLQPQALKQVISDMAEQLSGVMEERSLGRMGVLEFSNDTRLGEMLGANFGLLGRYCAEELERRLVDRAAGKFNVVDRARLQEALKQKNFGLKDLSSAPALKDLSTRTGGMPVLARGTLIDRSGRMVNLRCKLIETEGDATVAMVGGLARLSESEWAMIGRSVQLSTEDRQPDAPSPGVAPPRAQEDTVVDRADEKARGSHPLQDPKFPFPLKVMVGGKESKLVFKKAGEGKEERWDCFVPMRSGDVYEIWVENRTGNLAIMRLLIDGLNTLPEKEVTKGVSTMIWGKRVNLEEARPWVLDPAKVEGQKKLWAFRGFVTETGEAGKLRQFTVVDADKSLAARQQFTDQIGLITAAFYSPASGARGSLGTAAGAERSEELRERESTVGNMLAVVHLRYVDAAALAADGK